VNNKNQQLDKNKRLYPIFGWAAALATVLQTAGLVRYISRLPNDWVGISLYIVTILAFAGISAGAFIQARK
jgi:hypothetical protein